MPVTSFALLLFSAASAAGLTVWAMSVWGFLNVVPVLLGLGLVARWACTDVPFDDGQA